MPNDPPFREVSLYVEQEGTNKFKIQSNQLEQIGAQLRGPREFLIFQSILLPLIVTIATLIFTSLFQYVSWFNSVNSRTQPMWLPMRSVLMRSLQPRLANANMLCSYSFLL